MICELIDFISFMLMPFRCNLRVELDGKAYCNVVQEKSYLVCLVIIDSVFFLLLVQEDATKQLIDWVTSSEDFNYIDLNLNSQPVLETRLRSVSLKFGL